MNRRIPNGSYCLFRLSSAERTMIGSKVALSESGASRISRWRQPSSSTVLSDSHTFTV
jgi:hypothetical protein